MDWSEEQLWKELDKIIGPIFELDENLFLDTRATRQLTFSCAWGINQMQTSTIRYFAFLLTLVIFSAPVYSKEKKSHIYPELKCGKTAVEQSSCMIRAILDDIKSTYRWFDNGGISEIKGLTTYSYRIAIPRNEAVDLFK